MTSDGWDSPRLSEDLELRPLSGGPQDYASTTDQPVSHVAVANEAGLLGYLWVCDAGDAADFLPAESAGDHGYHAWIAWAGLLRDRKGRGLSPSQALAELSGIPGHARCGRIVPGTRTEGRDLETLRNLAMSN